MNKDEEKNKRNDSTNLEELTNGYLKILNSPIDVKDEDTLVGFIFDDNINKYINTNVYDLNLEILKEKLVFLIPRLNNGKINIKENEATRPVLSYSQSKSINENQLKIWKKLCNIKTWISLWIFCRLNEN